MTQNTSNNPSVLSLLTSSLPALDRLSPRLASQVAETLFRTPPPRPPLSSQARTFLASARPLHVKVHGRRVTAHRWGEGPRVYLLHGWAGRSTQFHAFAPRLCQAGFEVVAIDAVGHGLSEGRTSSLPEFRDSLLAVVEATCRGTAPYAVLAHSMGGAATALALARGLNLSKVVMLATPTDPRRFLGTLQARLGLSDETMEHVTERIRERVGVPWDDLTVPALAPRLRVPLLVIHDTGDKDVSWDNAAAIVAAWPGARLISTEGLGHQRILKDPAVIRHAIDFLTSDCPQCSSCGRLLRTTAVHCLSCCMSLELFERDRRQELSA